MSDSQQVPDQRLAQMMETMRRLQQQNDELRGTLNAVVGKQVQPQETEDSGFDPAVDKALNKKVEKMLAQRLAAVDQEVKQRTGFVYDRTDLLEFRQKFGGDTWEKYGNKIEELRQNYERQGRWLPREEAYKHIFFEETARKPAPKPEAPQAPVFDPYLKQWTQPAQAPVETTPQAPAPEAPAAPPAQPPAAAVQARPEDFGLPPVGPQTASAPVPSSTGIPKDLWEADDKSLDAWAAKYGDVQL